MPSTCVRGVRTHTTLAYVEGWDVIAEANLISGDDAWDRQDPFTRVVFGWT